MQIALLVLDVLMLALACWTTGRASFWRNLLFVPGYSIFMSYGMRLVRLLAYIDEWFFRGSHSRHIIRRKKCAMSARGEVK